MLNRFAFILVQQTLAMGPVSQPPISLWIFSPRQPENEERPVGLVGVFRERNDNLGENTYTRSLK